MSGRQKADPSSAAALFDSEDSFQANTKEMVPPTITSNGFSDEKTFQKEPLNFDEELLGNKLIDFQIPTIQQQKTHNPLGTKYVLNEQSSEPIAVSRDEESTNPSTGLKKRYIEDTDKIGQIFDQALFDQISSFDHIQVTEDKLNKMKQEIKDKKRLQKERNVLTAQLSRDRKKIEVELLRENCINLTRQLNRVRNQLIS